MTFIRGDCLEKLDDVADASITTIYLDPPFDSGRDYKMSADDATGFSDTWKGDDYKKHEQLPFIPNFHPESFKYEADGNLSDVRMGYYINEKI